MRRFLSIVLVAFIVGALALVFSARPQYDDAQDAVDEQWQALAEPLDARYALVVGVGTALGDTPGNAEPIVGELGDAVTAWESASDGGSVAEGVAAANEMEALARRLDMTIRASAQLMARAEVVAAIDAVANAGAPAEADAFNSAVREYADKRSGPFRGLIARVLGYDSIPTLDLEAR